MCPRGPAAEAWKWRDTGGHPEGLVSGAGVLLLPEFSLHVCREVGAEQSRR